MYRNRVSASKASRAMSMCVTVTRVYPLCHRLWVQVKHRKLSRTRFKLLPHGILQLSALTTPAQSVSDGRGSLDLQHATPTRSHSSSTLRFYAGRSHSGHMISVECTWDKVRSDQSCLRELTIAQVIKDELCIRYQRSDDYYYVRGCNTPMTTWEADSSTKTWRALLAKMHDTISTKVGQPPVEPRYRFIPNGRAG